MYPFNNAGDSAIVASKFGIKLYLACASSNNGFDSSGASSILYRLNAIDHASHYMFLI